MAVSAEQAGQLLAGLRTVSESRRVLHDGARVLLIVTLEAPQHKKCE